MKSIINLILVILILPNISALDIFLDSPSEANLNQEFTVTIDTPDSDIYDVKIFVHNSEDTKITSDEYISEIYSNGWKNPWYYLKESFPDKKQYEIKVISNPGNREICARLRKSGASSFDTQCKPITIKDTQDESIINKDVENKPSSLPSNPLQTSQDQEPPVNNPLPQSAEKTNSEKLTLNSPTEQVQKTFTTSQEKSRIGLVYAFTIFTVRIIILLALRKL